MSPKLNGRNFADDIIEWFSFIIIISIITVIVVVVVVIIIIIVRQLLLFFQISLKFIPNCPVNDNPSLILIMA